MPELTPQDQQKVDEYLNSNVNSVERPPFKPLTLLLIIILALGLLSALAFWVAHGHGVV